jgi:hypothetical protein
MERIVGYRKLIVALGALLILVLDATLHLGLSDTARASLAAVAIGYFIGNGIEHSADAKKAQFNPPLVAPGVPSTRPASLAGDVQSIPVDK